MRVSVTSPQDIDDADTEVEHSLEGRLSSKLQVRLCRQTTLDVRPVLRHCQAQKHDDTSQTVMLLFVYDAIF